MAEYTPERAIADLREPERSLSHAECDRIAACIGKLCDQLATANQRPLFATTLSFDFKAHLARQRAFSERTFGPGARTAGVLDHIRKELREIEDAPADLSEWIDVVILALDGAWRAGYTPDQIICTLVDKQDKNERRTWPDWRTAPADRAIEHNRAEQS
jgi:hypothetical protein